MICGPGWGPTTGQPGRSRVEGAGTLARSHHVKRIYHAAAVYGVVGEGYHGIANVEQCITNALARLDWESRGYVESQEKRNTQSARPSIPRSSFRCWPPAPRAPT